MILQNLLEAVVLGRRERRDGNSGPSTRCLQAKKQHYKYALSKNVGAKSQIYLKNGDPCIGVIIINNI